MTTGIINKATAFRLVLVLQCLLLTPVFAFDLSTGDTAPASCQDTAALCDSIVTKTETGKQGGNESMGWDSLDSAETIHTFLIHWRAGWLTFYQGCLTECLASPLSIRAPPAMT